MSECDITFTDSGGEERTITVAHPTWGCGKLTDEAFSLLPEQVDPDSVSVRCGPTS